VMTLVGFILSGAAEAADLSAVAGHYRYEQYDVTLPDGRVLHLKDIGASEAFLFLTSDTRFHNRADPQFGSSERAVLKRMSGK
jgi:hypothetical protein